MGMLTLSFADDQQRLVVSKSFKDVWAARDFESLINWNLAWIEGDVDTAQSNIDHAVDIGAINATSAKGLTTLMTAEVLPYKNEPWIQAMSTVDRIHLLSGLVQEGCTE
jgi:hypothetical protein